MILTYKGLQDQVLRQLDETATDSPTTLALVKDAIQAAHYQRCTEFPWMFMLWPKEETITTVSAQHEYILHPEFHRPYYFRNTSQKALLHEVPSHMLQGDTYDWENDSGVAEHFTFWGSTTVKAQPSTASALQLVSSSASDTGQVAVKGEDSSGNIRTEIFTATGTTTVTGTVTFETVLQVTKAAPWTGTLSLYANSGATLVQQLLACEMARVYRRIFILESPSPGGETISYRFYRQPLPLVNDYDQPDLPGVHAQLLVWDALIQLSGYLTETTAESLLIWRQNQQRAELALYHAYAVEGQSLDAEPVHVRYIER